MRLSTFRSIRYNQSSTRRSLRKGSSSRGSQGKHLDIHGPSSDEAVLGTAFAAEVDTAAAVEHSPAAAGEDSLAGIGPVEEGNSLGEVVGGTEADGLDCSSRGNSW